MAEKVISETTPPLVDKGVTQRQLFLASEIINSKDFASINFVDRTEGGKDDKESSYITHHRPSITTIVTCYRDRPTFYKSSKKLIRAASRIYKAIVGRDVGNICDGYWIGRQPRQGAWQGDDEGHDKALHRRLESELGPCIHDAMKPTFDLSNTRNNSSDGSVEEASSLAISVMKFGSQRCDDRLENPSDRRVGVLFVDLDKVARDHLDCIFDNLSASARCSYNILNNILHWLSTHQHFYQELCWIVHVKSEILHQYVSPSSSGNGTDACAFLVTGEELLIKFASLPSHISTKKSDVAIKDTSNTQNQNTIRRLRDNKEAAHCPLSLYPARYIEIDPTMNESSSEDNNENDRHRTKIREICRFHNYDSERGCLRSKKALEKEGLKGCDMDHEHCHNCGTFGHLAFECPVSVGSVGGGNLEPLVFLKSQDGTVSSTPFHRYQSINRKTDVALPALVVVGGRLRGRTLAACEMLALSSSQTKSDENQWQATPNLLEHRGRYDMPMLDCTD